MHLLKAGPFNKYDCLRQFSFSTNEAAYLICFSFIQLLFLLAVRNFIGNIEMIIRGTIKETVQLVFI